MTTRLQDALVLAESILTDIEMERSGALQIARKAGRLARLLDDTDAMSWLEFETTGYPSPLTSAAVAAAVRSGREADPTEDGRSRYSTTALGELDQQVGLGITELEGLSSGGPASNLGIEAGRANQRTALRGYIERGARLRDKVIGRMHLYVAGQYHELRFGAAVETAFEVVRAEVDRLIASVVPEGLTMLSGALENSVSDNPEHWSNAAATCRRLLKLVADQLQPPGPPIQHPGVGAIKMGEENYINRLMAWIEARMASGTSAAMVTSELVDFGKRLDAAAIAGNKGAHASVSRYDASRFVTGTYLLVGDILRLSTSLERFAEEGSD